MLNWIKNKKKQDAVEAKATTPNNILYIWLLLGATVLTGLSLLVHGCDAAFTIWTSITCGGIASIVVAWLIDIANCKQLNKKAVEHRKTLLSNLYHVFDNGLQLLILESAEKDHYTDSKKWYEWIDAADEQAQHNPDLIPYFLHILTVFFDDVTEQIVAIKNQEALLLDLGIVCQNDIHALSTILNICDISRITYNRSNISDYNCFHQLNSYCGLIKGIIDFSPTLRQINDTLVEPSLYHKAVEMGIFTPPKDTEITNE